MLQKEINLSEVLEYYRKNRVNSFDEDVDQFGEYFVKAATIAVVILAPNPVVAISNFCSSIALASLRVSKLISWLPEKFKYKEKGREKFAVERYELASVVNFMLLQIAIKNGIKDVIMPELSTVMEYIKFEEADKSELDKAAIDCDREAETTKLPLLCHLSRTDFENHSFRIIDPIFSIISRLIDKLKNENLVLNKFDISKIKETYIEKVIIYYNAFLINFSSEFPEFSLWSETENKTAILKELKNISKKLEANDKKIHDKFIKQTEQLIKKIDNLRKSNFISENGFPLFCETYKDLFQLQTDLLINKLTSRIKDNIVAHHNKIKSELNKPLIDNQDIEGIIYPKNKEIYIAQSFQTIIYRKKEHKKGFLTATILGESEEKQQNIGNYLLQTLIDPNYATRPIIILGNPGAGKSMLSKMFAGLLCDTPDFIPFLIKLRSVASSTANLSEHINRGLLKSIESTSDVNWLDWAKEFKERIPVIIMDGFDELMQSSTTELNNYLNTIKEFQDTALHHGIAVRVILTSRITVMQDVSIPDGTKLIKLDSFDQSRRDLWVEIWNKNQTKESYKFVVPKNEKIEHLAQEPLLMFMLAVYDFEKSELQYMTKEKNFNQSKLYDSLLNNFIERQLKKNELYNNASHQQQRKEEELFRLRLGMIALMMFLNDTTHKDTQKLSDELESFGLHESKVQTDNVLGGFFFIHENKSTTEGDIEKMNYEFLHKTFGEFLAADFMLRVALKQCERSREKIYQKYIFKFCFGYNWLHKHYNIQNFLFEHAPQVIKPDQKEHDIIVNDVIKPDIEALFQNGNVEFPIRENQIQPHKQVIEHLGIYSQNLIFLWLSISRDNEEIRFEIFDSNEKIEDDSSESKYESQDRDETNKNKLLWKRLAKLWTLVGNYNATAKLSEWIKVTEMDNSILLSKQKSVVNHNFSDSAKVACNDFELLLSLFDKEYKFSKEVNILGIADNVVKKKPELSSLAIDSLIYRFYDLFSIFGLSFLEWFREYDLSEKQQVSLIKKIGSLKWNIPPHDLMNLLRFFERKIGFSYRKNLQVTIEYVKILLDLKSYYPLTEILSQEHLEEVLDRLTNDLGYFERENPLVTLECIKLLSEFNRYYPYRREFRNDYLEKFLYRLIDNIHHSIGENQHLIFKYLKLINELRKYYPISERLHSELFEQAFLRISNDIQYIGKGNPSIIFEFLNLFYNLRKQSLIRKAIPSEFYETILVYLSEQWEYLLQEESFNLFEHLKVISGLKHHFPIRKIIPTRLIDESFARISHELYYVIKENIGNADEYLKVIKYLFDNFHDHEYMGHRWGNVFDETINRLFQDFEMKTRGNSHLILIHLELVLIRASKEVSRENKHALDRLIEILSRRDFGDKLIQKVILLLIKYNAESNRIEYLLDKYPRLKSIFIKSPELAKNILEAMNELSTDEIRN